MKHTEDSPAQTLSENKDKKGDRLLFLQRLGGPVFAHGLESSLLGYVKASGFRLNIRFMSYSILFIPILVSFSIPTVSGDTSPQRIISLGPVITEELYLLGMEEKLVGVTTYCERPEDAKKKEKRHSDRS